MTRRAAPASSRRAPASPTLSHTVTRTALAPPPITAMCVDVRELLRYAATRSDVPRGVQAIASDRQLDTSTLPSVSQHSLQQTPVTPPLHCNKEPVFWPPSCQPFGGFAARCAPPPLSPTDPVIVDAILGPPSVQTIRLSGFDQKPKLGMPSESALMSPPTQPFTESGTDSPHLMASFTRRFSATSTDPPPCGDSGVVNSSMLGDSVLQGSTAETVAPSVSLPRELTAPPTPLADTPDHSWDAERSHAAGDVGCSKISQVAQQTMTNVLRQLENYTAEPRPAKNISVTERSTDAYPMGRVVLMPLSSTSARSGGAGGPSTALPSSCRGATSAESTISRLWSRCPALAAATFSRVDMRQHKPTGASDAPVAHHQGLAFDRSNASVFRSPFGITRASEHVPRIVPAAFRRQLEFVEAAPTTRRPKRK